MARVNGQIWETRPLEFWDRAKELRAGWEQSAESKEKIVGQGHGAWAGAFPAITIIEDNPRGSTIAAKDMPFARTARLASEVRGWGRELCGYHGVLWGCQFLGQNPDGTPFNNRKLVVPMPATCDQHTKRGIQCRDFEPVPQWQGDATVYVGENDFDREVEMVNHRVYNELKMINDIERIFGQKFDEDAMREIVGLYSKVAEYRAEIFMMQMNTPAPLSAKDLYSFYTLGGRLTIDPVELEKFWKLVRDEIRWRVDNKIAAVGTERFRFLEAHPPQYSFLKYYRYLEQYGAVCVGSQYTNFTAAVYERKPNGEVAQRETNPPRRQIGIEEFKTREDLFRRTPELNIRGPGGFKSDENHRPYALNEFADMYHCDGAFFWVWRCGVGCTMTRKEQAIRLRRAGYSVLTYEGSAPGDPTDLDEKRFLEQLDAWMETNNLVKYEN
ncbi:MAG: 2-hydroxyacyl-CoA dehydratase [Clostridiales bacterium]|nr:2-hydroxyacyl-CoA dehydratase [Clostridiales bacterium]